MTLLTIVVPVYNEVRIATKLIEALSKISPTLKNSVFLIVDDGSNDGTTEILQQQNDIPCTFLSPNGGKGAAIKHALSIVNSQYFGVFDGDLEYDPQVISNLDQMVAKLNPLNDVVFCSRYIGKSFREKFLQTKQSISSVLMNELLVLMYRILFRIRLSDPLTGVKIYPVEFLSKQVLTRLGFDGDHEITIKLIKGGYSFIETAVGYEPRSRAEGKKIGTLDAMKAIRTVILGRL
jgi:glycosyltransferase involved in cell wall biosynthesis